MRRSYLKEGEVQLTALNSLLTQSRYFFLFSDLLLVAKQKAENSYKLKEKVRIDRLWIASNNCPHSFLIGWPISNYVAHFPSEEKKTEWHNILEERIQKCRLKIIPKFTTLPLVVRINGRNQIMKKKVTISQTSHETLVQLIGELGLTRDLELELAFDSGTGEEPAVLQGPEAIYCIVMDFIRSTGYRLSEKQLERLDTFPLVNCKLVLFTTNAQRTNAAQTLVTHFKRVLSRSESRRFFGRHLDGSYPPQPVLTMIDHLLLNAVNTEGLFRKSPKQTTVRMIKVQLNRGSVPDFSQFSPHVTAAILKEYLRSIPGKLLQTCNLNMWMAAMESDGPERIAQIRGFIQLLPSPHIVLLSSLLRLLRAVAKSPSSKMNAQSLAVCIAPSLLESPKVECAARRLPQIAEWLIMNAPLLFDDFTDAHHDMSSAASNDSGLSDVDAGGNEVSASPEFTETYVISTPASSVGSSNSSPAIRCRIHELKMSSPSYSSSNLSTEDEMEICTEIEKEDEDRTPVLSRENSSVEKKPVAFIEWKPAKRERFLDTTDDDARWKDNKHLKRRETVGGLYRKPEGLSEVKLQESLLSNGHRPIELTISTSPIVRSQDGRKASGISLPALPKFGEYFEEDATVIQQTIPKAITSNSTSPKTLAMATVGNLTMKEVMHLVTPIITEITDAEPEVSNGNFTEPAKTKQTLTIREEKKLSPIPENKAAEKAASTVVRNDAIKPHFKITSQKAIENNVTRSETFDHGREKNARITPVLSTISHTESSLKNDCTSRTPYAESQKKFSLKAQHAIFATKSLPSRTEVQYSEMKQRPSTSKAYEESVNAETGNVKQEVSCGISTASSEDLKVANTQSAQPWSTDKKPSPRSLNKLTPVQQKLRNRGLTSVGFEQSPKSQLDIDIDLRVGGEEKTMCTQGLHHSLPSSSLTINLPIYKTADRPSTSFAAVSTAEQATASGIPGPEKPPNESFSFRDTALRRNFENKRNETSVLREKRESFRRERKKNRSILMDPIEVNWSVDELRLKFQTGGDPPKLNTEYSPRKLD